MTTPFTAFPIATAPLFSAANTVAAGGTFTLTGANQGDVVVTTTAAVTIQLPAAATRNGWPVRIADMSGAPAITILTSGVEQFLGLTSIPLATPYGGFTLWPLSTGGWYNAG